MACSGCYLAKLFRICCILFFSFFFFVPIVHTAHYPSVRAPSPQANALSLFYIHFLVLRVQRDRPNPPSIMLIAEDCWVKHVFSHFQLA